MVAQRKHQSRIRLIRPVKGGEDGSGGSVNRAARAGQQASPCRGELNKNRTLDGGGRRERVTCGCLGKKCQGREAAPAMPSAVP